MWEKYYTPSNMEDVVGLISEHAGSARVVAGATDIMLELERGLRKGISALVDVTRIPGLDQISVDDQGWVHLGPLVSHNHCAGSELIVDRAFTLARACWEVGAPQIRNRGTIAGNLITASPANDSIPPLMALGAKVTLRSSEGEREVDLDDFYLGVRKTVMRDDEVLVDISFPLPAETTRSTFIKLALRRAQAISVINVAIVLKMDGDRVDQATITLGAVAPTIIHAEEAEAFLKGKTLSEEVVLEAGVLAMAAARPINDIRASAEYRKEMVKVCTQRGLRALQEETAKEGFPLKPVMLWGADEWHWDANLNGTLIHPESPIETTINGESFSFTSGHHKSLLRLIREEAGITGPKEGCAEGECGACTIYLDGMAVMSCMVPAPRAHGAVIETIEGLATDEELHPLQEAFILEGAVQCGYCTPGFLMSGAKLFEENPEPNVDEIKQSITGNLCRCTGYYKIITAFERAVQIQEERENGKQVSNPA
jgi:xanthine dehydrogenase iron-sulfur cluster and FAD-binding subunit A